MSMANLMRGLKWYRLSRQIPEKNPNGFRTREELIKMNKTIVSNNKLDIRMKDNGINTLQDIRATEWFAPIRYLQQRTGLSRVVEALGPIGKPPITLDSSSVSEGTL